MHELPKLIDSGTSFDLILADPPYNIGKDFGNDSDARPIGEYVEWAWGWIDDCLALLKSEGILYLYGLPEIVAHIAVRYPLETQRWLVWHYTNKTVPSSQFWQRSHETILCLWKPSTARPQLEIDAIRQEYQPAYLKQDGRRRKGTPSRFGGGDATTYNAHPLGALPRDVIEVPALAGGAGHSERWIGCETCNKAIHPKDFSAHQSCDTWKHPTQKPMALTERLIRSRIKTERTGTGRMLIPFAGSGSECVVAQALGVEFVAIEVNPQYVKFANQWLDKTRHMSVRELRSPPADVKPQPRLW